MRAIVRTANLREAEEQGEEVVGREEHVVAEGVTEEAAEEAAEEVTEEVAEGRAEGGGRRTGRP